MVEHSGRWQLMGSVSQLLVEFADHNAECTEEKAVACVKAPDCGSRCTKKGTERLGRHWIYFGGSRRHPNPERTARANSSSTVDTVVAAGRLEGTEGLDTVENTSPSGLSNYIRCYRPVEVCDHCSVVVHNQKNI